MTTLAMTPAPVAVPATRNGSEPTSRTAWTAVRNLAVAGVAMAVGLTVGGAVLVLSALALPYDRYLRSRRHRA